ncbi:hypothetical protein EAH83_18515 [Variovorax ginsengisoli]|uniref:Uncharacterized protein n=1 Tax=Variovorax guangxiensis TaxID=1775474 RepID=A0A502DN90_9BURK|nr:hypothetical protein EAH83_18515 [Variovorax ginsengisoli]TPG25671.1 hypothetical protein EAH82_14620 [Variovorax guangxiensis]
MNSPPIESSAETWIVACADRLQQRWRTVEMSELQAVASELWQNANLRGLPPDDAAVEWLKPVACAPCAPATSPQRHAK